MPAIRADAGALRGELVRRGSDGSRRRSWMRSRTGRAVELPARGGRASGQLGSTRRGSTSDRSCSPITVTPARRRTAGGHLNASAGRDCLNRLPRAGESRSRRGSSALRPMAFPRRSAAAAPITPPPSSARRCGAAGRDLDRRVRPHDRRPAHRSPRRAPSPRRATTRPPSWRRSGPRCYTRPRRCRWCGPASRS